MKLKDWTIITLCIVAFFGTILLSMPSDREIIATVLTLEAGGDGVKGMKAVASVIINRSVGYKMTPTQIVTKRNQFTCLNQGLGRAFLIASHDPRYSKAYKQAYCIAGTLINGNLTDTTNGALYFSSKTHKKGLLIGHQTFYNKF